MVSVTASLVKELRARTGIGVMDCKRALIFSKGNIDKSIDFLRKMGKIKAENKQLLSAENGSIFINSNCNNGVILELNCETDFVSKDKEFLLLGQKIVDFALNYKIYDLELIKQRFENLRVDLIMKCNENIVIRRFHTLNEKYITSYLHGNRIGVLLRSDVENILTKEIAMHIAASNPKYLRSDLVPKSVMEREYEIQLELAMQSKKPEPILKKIIKGRMEKFANDNSLLGQHFIFNSQKKVCEIAQENNIDIISFVRIELGEKV